MNHILCAALMPHPPIIIPEVGQSETDKVHATALALDAVSQAFKEYSLQTVIIISPHGLGFDDAITMSVHPRLRGTMAAFGVPDLSLGFETDGLLLRTIQKKAKSLDINLVEMTDDKAKSLRSQLELDHGAFIPLYYLHKAGFRGQIIHLSCGLVSYEEMYTFGKAVQSATAIVNKKIGIIASGDLSHRVTKDAPNGFHPRGAEFDQYVVDILQRGNLKELMNMDRQLAREIGECGLRPIFFLMGILGGLQVKSQVLSYEAPFGVGYAVAKFDIIQ
ncbi:aromatic ring-opening dioxygenase LigB subunit [Sporomusaceae bacterium BoRhaA]|uniref:AmmeMemoRadiSam system protein B n=1 Tax=Pelorhabdus rhamnosifermentans TaxID=2772457 RepID=UPI001C0610F8|nr:AmmeMemoRadiSam system protein B [Pelorhabdus rhamnosifermentans]MBU2702545.1 aromatic ring-opening dioxygenase LigB subunit [Pelorhabdus rhamnosifermentans]